MQTRCISGAVRCRERISETVSGINTTNDAAVTPRTKTAAARAGNFTRAEIFSHERSRRTAVKMYRISSDAVVVRQP